MKLEGTSIKQDFLKFIIPSVIAQWVFTLYTMIDGVFVARGVSEIALTAVNISFPFVAALFSISLLFAVGTSTVVAILLGEGKQKRVNEVFTQNITVLVVVSLAITTVVLLNLEGFAKFLGATQGSLPYVKEYIGSLVPFAVAFILSYSFEILIKTDGYPQKATAIVVVGAVMNCILDYLFVIVFWWGVSGAAVATGISQVFVIVLYLWHFLGPKATLRFTKFRLDLKLIGREFRNGLSSGVTEMSAGIIVFFFNLAITRYIGEDALVSYTIVSYINSIVVMSMTGIAQGSQPLISYYHGKKETATCRKLLRYGLISAAVFSLASVAICVFGAKGIVSLFVSAELSELRSYSANVLQIFSLSFLIAGYNVVVGGYFTSIEYAYSAIIITLARGFVTLLSAFALMIAIFGGRGIWWAPLVSEIVCLVLTAALFRRYRKRK